MKSLTAVGVVLGLVGAFGLGTSVGCGGGQASGPVTPKAGGDAGASSPDDVIGRKILHKKEVPEFPNKEAVMYLSTLPPHGGSGKHFHAGPELAYVISGSVNVETEGDPVPQVVHAGETFQTQGKKVHDVKNTSPSEVAKVIVFLLSDKGELLATPVKEAAAPAAAGKDGGK